MNGLVTPLYPRTGVRASANISGVAARININDRGLHLDSELEAGGTINEQLESFDFVQ